MKKYLSLAFVMVLLLSNDCIATTWGDIEIVCPICGTTNTFQAPRSYGSYIYEWPSKFQYVFWPDTTKVSLYYCKQCHLSSFMGDFEEIPKDKVGEIRTALHSIGPKTSKTVEYFDVPMTERFTIAEKVYSVLGRDEIFWCWFYRTMGYHQEEEGKLEAARESRRKSLNLASNLIQANVTPGKQKEFFVISGAMRYFLGDADGAIMDFGQGLKLTYKNPDFTDEESKDMDDYLTTFLQEYIKKIKAGENIPHE